MFGASEHTLLLQDEGVFESVESNPFIQYPSEPIYEAHSSAVPEYPLHNPLTETHPFPVVTHPLLNDSHSISLLILLSAFTHYLA